MTADVESCVFEGAFIQNYTDVQCREVGRLYSSLLDMRRMASVCLTGTRGPLCGACDESYGRTRAFLCEKCLPRSNNVTLVILCFVVLMCLSAVTIKSSLIFDVSSTQKTPDTPQASAASASTRSVVVNEQMVEMAITGKVPREILDPECTPMADPLPSAEDAELANGRPPDCSR